MFHQPVPTFEYDGLTLAYETWGDPESPAVILLHGFTADLRSWAPVARALAGDYFVVAPDLRGHGKSAAPAQPESCGIEAFAADLLALLDHLGLDLCAAVGSSFGGMVALQAAVSHPERFAALVLSDTSGAPSHPVYDERYWQRERAIDAATDVVRRFGTAELGKRAASGIADPFVARGIRERYARLSTEGWLCAAHARRHRPDLLPLLPSRLTMPVMVAYGEDDEVRSAAEVLAEAVPGARVVRFRSAGHGLPVVAPQSFIRELQRFFEDVENGRPVAGHRTAS